ncbi:AraC family transcriptional regulator [Metabacillus litoralis]|uniref:AraC family transcriptional regulator n=1 Tax=Metabacillus litoralis TaxID=152268 RepID=A0A5C6W0W5_9BACI|nr:helix-turn-helix domain-containing protein [Metabacillus litoralis]TXC90542.1 AraC family transcriptional regulator [Metabacillus litoralis]
MINIVLCSFSYHTRKFHSIDHAGFDDYLFRLQTEGSCQITVNNKKYTIEKGDLLLLKPKEQYELNIEEGQNSGDYYIFCRGSWIDNWWHHSKKPTVSRIKLDDKILNLWRYLIIEEQRPSSEQDKNLNDYLMKALCLLLERYVNETTIVFNRPPAVTRMMRYIEERALSPLKIEEVAKHVELSVSRASFLFKNSVGKTMIKYTQEIRLSSALDQMKYTSKSLEQIAVNCGFGSYPYFHKVFKKTYGVSPGIYRREE